MGSGTENSSRLDHSSKLPAGNLDRLSGKVQEHRPLWDASYVWGLEFLKALYHHRSVRVVRTPKP